MHLKSSANSGDVSSPAVLCSHLRLTPMVEGVAADQQTYVADSYLLDIKALICKEVDAYAGRLISSSDAFDRFQFPDSIKAVRCAVQMQKALDLFNKVHPGNAVFLLSVGVGVESDQELGDVASFLAESASPGEINLSEGLYLALGGNGGVFCRFTKQLAFNGSNNGLNVYEAFWNPTEIEVSQARIDLAGGLDPDAQPIRSFGIKLILLIIIMLALIFSLIAGYKPIIHLLSQIFAR